MWLEVDDMSCEGGRMKRIETVLASWYPCSSSWKQLVRHVLRASAVLDVLQELYNVCMDTGGKLGGLVGSAPNKACILLVLLPSVP